ncbi:Rne/Rng family ribonuclease [Mailhella massiliensis]|uniref:Ribonuclease G n=1 Tax=Mailhella massiliensis TaxID=1903261 RepID=A0A921DS55_9BACT|nr:Rne/Rng family ribonuclease [Mailhella massiliensis]HJD97803.1 Rne/Rng family ribonuclease [Mailhella massiliensis]
MSQNPVLPEENNEEINTAKTRRTKKAPEESAQAAPEEKKAARRTRKSASAAHEDSAEEKKPRRRTVKKAEAPEEGAEAEKVQKEKPARKPRSRRASGAESVQSPAETQAEGLIHIGSALVLDDMLPPSSMTVEQEVEAPAPEKKRRAKKNVKAHAVEESSPVQEAAADTPIAEKTPEEPALSEKKPRARRTSRKKKEAGAQTESISEEKLPEEEEAVIHVGSALVLDDMLPPSSIMPGEEVTQEEKTLHRQEEDEPSLPAEGEALLDEDNVGNRVAPAGDEEENGLWQDDGIVTNILPYPGEFDDNRQHPRSRRGRKNRDAQPAFNGSPYLPSSYQQNFYDQSQTLVSDSPFGNRKNRGKGKNRKNQGVPGLPDDFDFNAAMLNDSVLGVALGRQEEDFIPEDDGPQPALPGQPVAQPLSVGDMAEEDLAALDAAVNGNRIDMPQSASQKEGRGKGKNRKNQKEEKAEKPARAEKKVEAEEAARARRVLYVSVVPDEQVEVVITEDGQVTEYFVEMAHQVKIRGNIYKGIINNIDTNLQAAFVNFGNGKNGFLQIDEVHPEYYLVPHDATHGPKYPPIQKVLKVGQEVLVQVVKEPSGTKGAFLTTWISIAGRFLVLTPGQEQIGVSRKVEDPEERARLKDLLNGIQPGENMGVIIRTASEGASKASIQQDLQYLKKLWKDIQKKAPTEKSPSLIYQEADLATRSVRDYLSEDIVEIWTDDETTKARVEDIARLIFPDRAGEIVKLHKDQRQSLWERFNLLRQLETVTSREVVLPSGGRLVFDQTEALMAIDINSGKTQGKTNFEAMVFRTNMEAAEAIARHLRLRDIGGQVVIDFIEMRDKNHCREVERTLRNAMRKDRARHDVGHMSSFGLLELVRQRTGTSAISISCEPCPHCHGTGVRRNMEWQSLQALRDLQSKLCKAQDNGKGKKNEKTEPATFIYESDAELALYLLNRKRDRIAALEEKFGVHIEIRLK